MSKPHKHAALIKAWADGSKIEAKNGMWTTWAVADNPSWDEAHEYRIKRDPMPDIVLEACIGKCWAGLSFSTDKNTLLRGMANVRYTFDGETGELKAVEMVK